MCWRSSCRAAHASAMLVASPNDSGCFQFVAAFDLFANALGSLSALFGTSASPMASAGLPSTSNVTRGPAVSGEASNVQAIGQAAAGPMSGRFSSSVKCCPPALLQCSPWSEDW